MPFDLSMVEIQGNFDHDMAKNQGYFNHLLVPGKVETQNFASLPPVNHERGFFLLIFPPFKDIIQKIPY